MTTREALMNDICRIKDCGEPARFNFETIGHPNGDIASSYCGKHINGRGGIWTDSPTPYAITISGPFGGAR